jgi:S1-C subfamily serine protease
MKAFRYLAAGLILLTASCDLVAPRAALVTIENQAVGLALRELPRGALRSLDLRYGLAVVKAEAAAADAGLRLGDVIYGVNQKRIGSVADFARLVAERPPGAPLALLVRRGALDLYLPVDPGRSQRRSTDTLLRT